MDEAELLGDRVLLVAKGEKNQKFHQHQYFFFSIRSSSCCWNCCATETTVWPRLSFKNQITTTRNQRKKRYQQQPTALFNHAFQDSAIRALKAVAERELNGHFSFFSDGSVVERDFANDIEKLNSNDSNDSNHNSFQPLVFVVPLAHVGLLAQLLAVLDRDRQALFIESYSLYQTSLEEIFLKLAREDEEE